MEEEIKDNKPEEKKKRGRKKKEFIDETPKEIPQEEVKPEIPEEIVTPIETNEVKEVKQERSIPSLSDNLPDDNPVELGSNDVKLPTTKQDESFFKKIFKKNKMNKEGKVTVILLHPSTDADIHYVDIENELGDFHIGKEKYNVNEHCVYSLVHKKVRYPMCILPTWTMVPIGTKSWFELGQERRGHELEVIILNAIKKEEALKAEEIKKKPSAKSMWIWIALIIGGFLFAKSRGWV